MKEFDERTIWTSDQIPLMASYNRGLLISHGLFLPALQTSMLTYTIHVIILCVGKMQHSVWVAHYMNSNHIMENISSSDAVPDGVLPKYLSFQRIWQGKGAQTAACKVLIYLVHFLLSYVTTF